MVGSANHPDLHLLTPEGPAGQIGIGQVRALASALALLPVEGGPRVAIVEAAHRLTEDTQHALLKTLEEPPSGVTIILCADDEERLLPTVRSRCARVRLGPVAVRDIERLIDGLGLADPPAAARFARLSAGRPGLAVSYARAPEAAAARGEVARRLLDLLAAGPAVRLRAARELIKLSDEAVGALTVGRTADGAPPTIRPARRRVEPGDVPDDGAPEDVAPARASAADRRRAAAWLIDAWTDLTRDLAVLDAGDPGLVRDAALLEELRSAAAAIVPGAAVAFLERLGRATAALEVNASPELVVDVLALAWPRHTSPAHAG
jgi:DNA polymerase-3 subunit delta'